MPDLFVTSYTPTLGAGRALRTYAIIRALAEHGPVDVLYTPFGADEPSPEFVGHPNIRLHAARPSRGLGRILAYAGARAAGTPESLARGVSVELGSMAEKLAAPAGQGRVVADGMTAVMALRRLARRRPIIYNAHNLESSFQHELGDDAYGTPEQVERFERRVLDRVAESWMVSHADVTGALRLCPDATVRYVPNVVDVEAITPVRAPLRDGPIVLVANFTWVPNVQAARFLLDEVMPRVWARRPEAHLALVGRGLELDGPIDPRVELLGFVDDLDAQYDRASCAVVPLLSGGGSPLKFVEALAHGIPVVATPLAARGLDHLVAGEHYLEAEAPQAFADALVSVLADGAGPVAAAGRAVAEREYSIATLSRILAPDALDG